MKRIAFLILVAGLGFAPAGSCSKPCRSRRVCRLFQAGRNRHPILWGSAAEPQSTSPSTSRSKRKWPMISIECSPKASRIHPERTITTQNSNLRVLHGLFGPKFQTSGPVRVFVTVKGGFTNFRFDPTPASFSTFTSSVTNLRANNVDAALYPGGGVEAFLGPIGLRLEAGDEIIFVNGAHNNWKVTFRASIAILRSWECLVGDSRVGIASPMAQNQILNCSKLANPRPLKTKGRR